MQPSAEFPWHDLSFDDYTSAGVWYYRPCGVVTQPQCVAAFGYTAQLCFVNSRSGGAVRISTFNALHNNYSTQASYQWQLTALGADMHTTSGSTCASDPTRAYNVTIHFECHEWPPFDTMQQSIRDMYHHPDDACRVEGTVWSNAFCTLWPEQWTSSAICQFGPYNYTDWYEQGDMAFTTPRLPYHNSSTPPAVTSSILFHPCGFVREPLCTAVDPTVVLCNLTTFANGSSQAVVLSHWNGAYDWLRFGGFGTAVQGGMSYDEEDSVQWYGSSTPCARFPVFSTTCTSSTAATLRR